MVLHIVAPPPMPEPGTHEDRVLLADLNARIDAQFKVKVLRGKCLGVAKQLKGSREGGWTEVVEREEEQQRRRKGDELVSQMQGAKGLGVERVFWDRSERKLVAVIWFGGALSGWPGVAHGGAIATAMAEKAALAASLVDNRADAMATAAETPQRLPGTGSHAKIYAPAERHDEPAQLSLSYVKPTHANRFYVIRVSPCMDMQQSAEDPIPLEPHGGQEYEATLETLDALVCVKAKVKFAPSNYTLRRTGNEAAGAAKSNYADFKHWLWPSRQASTHAG